MIVLLVFFFINIEFIKVITAEANKICLNDGKKTISPEFIYKALKVILQVNLEFGI
jgi:histone H3/H4